jgi:Secretion system C-terminal sorting domain/Carboxypeptidase regulatory-like domain
MKRISLVILILVTTLSLILVTTLSLKAQFIVNNNGIDLVSTTTLSANGDWVNSGVFTNNGILVLKDNWTNQGTYVAGNGQVILDYGVNHSFNHNSQAVASLVKLGIGNATLIGNVLVLDSLRLGNGVILTNADTLMVDNGAFINSTNGSHVAGQFTNLGNGNKYFPVGNGNNAYPVALLQISGAAPKVTASVEAFPAGYTAGAGVDSLLNNFPVAWRINASAQTDTASYLTFQFPENLVAFPSVAVVARAVSGNRFEGMGKRSIDSNSGTTKLTSYSKGLKGLFTIVAGFGGNFETDSLALVTFYNNTGATAWTKDNNWLNGNVNTWQGITQTGGSITAITLDAANITGSMPSEIADILSLTSVNVANNNISAIPDFSGLTALTSLNISNNNLDFASLEYNAGIAGVNYLNQKSIDLQLGDSVLVDAGTDYTLVTNIGGTQNNYTYLLNNVSVSNVAQGDYLISAINKQNMGSYQVQVTNPLVPNLTLTTLPTSILAVVDISGRMLVNETTPAQAGSMNLFRVTTTGAYDTLGDININADGTYLFEKVVLDKYLVLCKPDASLYPLTIPTYYANTIFWEEATAIDLQADITGLDIIAQSIGNNIPTGNGILGGFFEEDDGTGTRVERTRRVQGAGVTARRTQGTGRGKDVVYILVGYTTTDTDGNFNFSNLPQGDYRLNIQYPGNPMDSTSFIEFTIGAGLDAEVQVAATVIDGKITVRERIVTGIFEAAEFKANVFPNPVVEILQVEFENVSVDREMVLIDLNGSKLKQQGATETQCTLNVADLSSGTYLLQIKEGSALKKIVRVVIQ